MVWNKKNYQAWLINTNEFPKQGSFVEQAFFLLRYAVLAPSSHNSQPWCFAIKDDSIIIKPDYRRVLPQCDPDKRLLHIALGSATENVSLAAIYFGFDPLVNICTVGANVEINIALRFTKQTLIQNSASEELFLAIPRRRTNRSPYNSTFPESSILNELLNLKQVGTRLDIVSDDKKNSLAKLINDARVEAMASAAFRWEMARYKKNNFTTSYVGMPGFDMGFTLGKSLILPWALRFLNVAKMTYKSEMVLLQKHTPVIAVVSTLKDGVSEWVQAGRLLQRALLLAEARKMNTAITVSAMLVGNFYESVQKLIPTNARPQVAFRLGFSNQNFPVTPRFPVEKLMYS